jgi:hypothetical protein
MVLVDVLSVRILHGFVVELAFDDDTVRTVDLEPLLVGPIFDPVRRDPDLFRSVRVDAETGTIAWPNGADIDPQVLRFGLEPAA